MHDEDPGSAPRRDLESGVSMRIDGLWRLEDRLAKTLRPVPFEVPAHTAEIAVTLDYDQGRGAVLDLGLAGPEGFRGWSGSARASFAVGPGLATPGYLPGPVAEGVWHVWLGLHRVPPEGVPYSLEIRTGGRPDRTAADAPPAARGAGPGTGRPAACRPERRPPRDLPGLDGRRWYAGDLHTHTEHSDGALTVDELADHAFDTGLDFVAVTDHNTVSHHPLLPGASERSGVLLIPGQEVTAELGHASVWGADTWIDFRKPAAKWMQSAAKHGGLFCVNHPLDSDRAWRHPLTTQPSIAEVWPSTWRDRARGGPLAWARRHPAAVVPVGGSDFHGLSRRPVRAGVAGDVGARRGVRRPGRAGRHRARRDRRVRRAGRPAGAAPGRRDPGRPGGRAGAGAAGREPGAGPRGAAHVPGRAFGHVPLGDVAERGRGAVRLAHGYLCGRLCGQARPQERARARRGRATRSPAQRINRYFPPGHRRYRLLPFATRVVRGGNVRTPPHGHHRGGSVERYRLGRRFPRHPGLRTGPGPRRGDGARCGMTDLVVVPHTHWDREWYLPFQRFRLRLVTVLDRLLAQLAEDPRARFTLDGQTAAIDDYLEIRPEQDGLVRELVERGRLAVGPWRVLADSFLCSGENLVRNLEIGMRRANDLGGALMVGYLPDQFGHAAQLPQILRIAGIEHACLWRGVPDAVRTTAFRWVAPDGSAVRCQYLPEGGYGGAAGLFADPDPRAVERRAAEHVRALRKWQKQGALLGMYGTDHSAPVDGLADIVEAASRLAAWEETVHPERGAVPVPLASQAPMTTRRDRPCAGARRRDRQAVGEAFDEAFDEAAADDDTATPRPASAWTPSAATSWAHPRGLRHRALRRAPLPRARRHPPRRPLLADRAQAGAQPRRTPRRALRRTADGPVRACRSPPSRS